MSAYLDALKMLARRELSEMQVRQRLTRRGHEDGAIEEAIERLRTERAIDDGRVAEAIARTQVSVRGRGKLRVLRQIEAAGIARTTAKSAVDEVYGSVDANALLDAALAKRLRGRAVIEDDRERQKLYRHLVSQGFEPDAVLSALRKRAKSR